MRLTYYNSVTEVYEVNLEYLKEAYGRELAEWQLENPGKPIEEWVKLVWEEGASEGEGFDYSDEGSTYSEEVTVEE